MNQYSPENPHHIEPKTLFAYILVGVVVIFGLYFYLGSPAEENAEEVNLYGDYEVGYIEQDTNIEIPGSFPIDLLSNATLLTGSYLFDTSRGSSQYTYTAASQRGFDSEYDFISEILLREGFMIVEEIREAGLIRAERFKETSISTEQVSYSIKEGAEEELQISIVYEINNVTTP